MTGLWTYFVENDGPIGQYAISTVELAIFPLIAGILLGTPIGLLCRHHPWVSRPVLPLTRLLYTVPSLVMFLLLPAVIGTKILDPLNVAVALTVYTLALIIPTAAAAFASVPPQVLLSAEAMGQNFWQRFTSVELPLAIPVLSAGIRVAAVSNVSLISVASIIGTEQLGQLFVTGTNLGILAPIIIGLLAFLALALLLDLAIVLTGRAVTPWNRTARA
jgi:osmoprotectant transport system permease protein